jgi:hypothetical protein
MRRPDWSYTRGRSRVNRFKRAGVRALIVLFVVAQYGALMAVMLPAGKTKAASLPVASATSETQQTTASTTYTASDTSISSGSLSAGTYFVAWGAAAGNSGANNRSSVRLVRGTTEVSAMIYEGMAATSAAMGTGRSGYWLGTLSGSEALTIEYSGTAGTTYIDGKFIKAIKLSTNLTADADYFSSGSQESSADELANAVTTGWTDVKALTKTFSSSASQDYLVFASMEISPDSTVNDCSSRIEVDGTAAMASTIEGENVAEIHGYAMAKKFTIGTGAKSIKLQGQSVNGATCDFLRSRIYVFRAGLFDQVVENYASTESTLASATWTDVNSQLYTPNQSETAMVIGSRALGTGAITCSAATRFDDGTSQYAEGQSFVPNNITDYAHMMSAASLTVSAAKTFKLQYQRATGACTVKIKESTLIVWSMTLRADATYGQSGYRWFENTAGVGNGWWNNSWASRRKVTFNNSQSTENLANFPVRVSLIGTGGGQNIDYAKTQNAGQDIRFVDADGAVLKHEIEVWNEAGRSEVWVKVPQIDSGSTTDYIWMYYNNAVASDGQDAANVWDSDFKVVQHLKETGACAVTFLDSTANANNGTCGGTPTSTTGTVGSGRTFNGTTDFIDESDRPGLFFSGPFTFETWVNPTAGFDTTVRYLFGDYATAGNSSSFALRVNNNATVSLFWENPSSTFPQATSTTALTSGTWYHIVGVWDGTTRRVYINGVQDGTNATAQARADVGGKTTFGRAGDFTGSGLPGALDEVRISGASRSGEWVEASYLSTSNAMNSYGAEEANGGAIANPLAATNTPYSLTTDGAAFRLRLLLHIATNDFVAGTQDFKLQAAPKSGTCDLAYSGETFSDVSPSSGAIRYNDNAAAANGAVISTMAADPTHSGHAVSAQTYVESNNFSSTSRLSAGQDGMWEFSLIDFSAANGSSYCFRVVKADGSAIATPEVVPEINMLSTPPLSPTALTQTKTNATLLSTGSWTNETSVIFTATVSDPDASDILQLCVERDILATSFSNTEDSCGSPVDYSGTPLMASVTLTGLSDANQYHWQARVRDTSGGYSSWVSYGGNAESARDFGVDTTAPTGGTVYDGTQTTVDTTFSDSSLSALSANWAGFVLDASGLAKYEYSIGTTAGITDVKNWTDVATATSVTATGLNLQTSKLYYVNVRATDAAGNSLVRSSNGQLVAPSLTTAVSPASVTFGNLRASNNYTDTQTTTVTTSTNAYGGYSVRAFAVDLLRAPSNATIGAFSGGSYANPDSWQAGDTGFGYTSNDTTILGGNKFQASTCPGGTVLSGAGCYAPFSLAKPGDIIADHTDNVTAAPIINESYTITLRATATALQQAARYQTTLVYAVTPVY